MDARPRILLVDDDPQLLEMYQEVLARLPSHPHVLTAGSGARAMAMLEADPFRLLICDLKMPKMDGLQVLSIVRRKYPQLRTVAMTGVVDEHFRQRAYALGVDLFWHKPSNETEIRMFQECLESLLGREQEHGFRGLQSKSLVDIIQLECISQSSSVLRITNSRLTGKIWIQEGEIIDAEAAELRGEPAFRKILSWKAGNFETLAADPSRARTINKSYNGLLLETAQALDESQGATTQGSAAAAASQLAQISQVDGVEFVLAMKSGEASHQVARGLENPDRMAVWSRQSLERFRGLGDRLHAGQLDQVVGLGPQRHVALGAQAGTEFCIGWRHSMTPEEIRDMTGKVLALWVS